MRLRFTHSDLTDSKPYYDQFFDALLEVSKTYIIGLNKNKNTLNNLCKGAYCYKFALDFINDYNRVSMKLFGMDETTIAAQLIRIELDLLTAIYADTKWPFQILYKIYYKGKTLDKIKKNGNYLKQGELRKKIDTIYNTNICGLYKTYSNYVHPSQIQNVIKHIELPFDCLEYDYYNDLKAINQTLGNILSDFIEKLNNNINTKKEE